MVWFWFWLACSKGSTGRSKMYTTVHPIRDTHLCGERPHQRTTRAPAVGSHAAKLVCGFAALILFGSTSRSLRAVGAPELSAQTPEMSPSQPRAFQGTTVDQYGSYISQRGDDQTDGEQPEAALIATERCDGIAERVYWDYTDPDVAMRSYAAVDRLYGCSGTMIGPNIMMTASHCGDSVGARFPVYVSIAGSCGGTDPGVRQLEDFPADNLINTFPDTDITLAYCPPVNGINPGDKYGYVDFDVVMTPQGVLNYSASRSLLTVGTQIYSIWQNPIEDFSNPAERGGHLLYSEGTLTEINRADDWFNPLVNPAGFGCVKELCVGGTTPGVPCKPDSPNPCPGGSCVTQPLRNLAVFMDLWTNGGGSGSSQLSADSHRILVGPTSTGCMDCPGRTALSIADYLRFGWADSNMAFCSRDHVNRTALTNLGIADPTIYYGLLDKNGDGLFDVQHDLEMLAGEGRRDWYFLGFESARRNALWSPWPTPPCPGCDPAVSFDTSDPVTGLALLNMVGGGFPGYWPTLLHRRLNLQADRFYRISLMANLSQASQRNSLQVCLRGTGDDDCFLVDPPVGSWSMHVARLWAPADAELEFSLRDGTRLSLAAVSVIEDGAVMDFDTHDKRYPWRDENTGGRGLIWPNGVTSNVQADWAGVVRRDPSRPGGEDWSLRNRQLVLNAGDEYRVCFSYRNSEREPLPPNTTTAALRIMDAGGMVPLSGVLFLPRFASWTRTCSFWFRPSTDDNNLQFGFITTDTTGAYLVDDLAIERRGSPTVFVDWRNDGINEDGSTAEPFSKVVKGVNSVRDLGVVRLWEGNYDEQLTIDRPMTLTATVANRAAVIGQ